MTTTTTATTPRHRRNKHFIGEQPTTPILSIHFFHSHNVVNLTIAMPTNSHTPVHSQTMSASQLANLASLVPTTGVVNSITVTSTSISTDQLSALLQNVQVVLGQLRIVGLPNAVSPFALPWLLPQPPALLVASSPPARIPPAVSTR
jgi:hypothetical protein